MIRFFLLIIIFFSSIFLQSQTTVSQTSKNYLRPPEGIKHFTFGYNDALASILWMRVMQSFDHCETGKYSGDEDYVAPDQNAKNKLQGIFQRKIKPSKCHKGWVYSMLDVMTEIQARFKTAYEVGAIFLSVAVDDREGARLIFEKAVKQYPDDWKLSYAAGYHYLWEMQDPKRSADLLLQSLNSGGPPYLASLAAGIYNETGQALLAQTILLEALQKNPPPDIIERIQKRLKEVELILKKSQ